MPTKNVKNTAKAVIETPEEIKKGVVANCQLLNVRAAARKDASIVKTIPEGTEVEILDEKNGFYKIENGYVMKDFIKLV